MGYGVAGGNTGSSNIAANRPGFKSRRLLQSTLGQRRTQEIPHCQLTVNAKYGISGTRKRDSESCRVVAASTRSIEENGLDFGPGREDRKVIPDRYLTEERDVVSCPSGCAEQIEKTC